MTNTVASGLLAGRANDDVREERPSVFAAGRRAVLMLWALSLVLLLSGLGSPAVRRTQEARVLETAREMLETGTLQAWLIPHLHGDIRLKKPPLAYWLSAVSFQVLGVCDFSGRVPGALAGWLLLAVTYWIGARIFGSAAGLLASGVLAASYFFTRFTRLAETDLLTTLFVTAGIACAWTFLDRPGGIPPRLWLAHACAACIAMAILTKGPPALFVPLFLVALSIVRRDLKGLWLWFLSGAPVTVAAVALPWFLYVRALPEWQYIGTELGAAISGVGHRGPWWFYGPQTLIAIAPWSGFLVVALLAAVLRCRSDRRLAGIVCWIAAIVVPLCLAGQKQPHYLLPALPAFAILVGWLLAHADVDRDLNAANRIVFVCTGAIVSAGSIAIVLASLLAQGSVGALDVAIAAMSLTAGLAALYVHSVAGSRAGAAVLAIGVAVVLAACEAWWIPSVKRPSMRQAAAELHARFGTGPFCSFGPGRSTLLSWELRTVIPHETTAEGLSAFAHHSPSVVAVVRERKHLEHPALPPEFVERLPPIPVQDEVLRTYTLGR